MATTAPTDGHVPPDPYGYVTGAVHPQTKDFATFDTKPPSYIDDVGRWDTGAGYERWRSTEYRPHTPTVGKESVYVSHHRLLAVVECYPLDMPIEEVRDDLDGSDVHHTTGSKWCNFGESPNFDEPGLEVLDHADHASRTQAQMRAWAEDAKRQARDDPEPADRCGRCGDDDGPFWRCEDFDGRRCTDCAKHGTDGAPLEAV